MSDDVSVSATRGSLSVWRKQEHRAAFVFILPAVLGLVALRLLPIGASLWIGLTETKLMGPAEFIGLENYGNALGHSEFYRVIGSTFYFSFGTQALTLVVGLTLALVLNSRLRGITVYRAIYFFPFVTTWTAVALIWNWFLSTDLGLVNHFLGLVGIQKVSWLSSPKLAMLSVILVFVWKAFGYKMVILLAGLQGIPASYYEVAAIDGARRHQVLFRIVLPLLTPAIFFSVITGIISSMQIFDPIMIMTQGGPARVTTVVGYYIFEQGFQLFKLGYAAAASWLLFLLILVMTMVQWIFQKRWVFYG